MPNWCSNRMYFSAEPAQITEIKLAATCRALNHVWREGYRYMKAGVMLADFTPSGIAQPGLFDEIQLRKNSEKLMKTLGSNRMYFSAEPAQITAIKRLASGAVTPLYRRSTNEGIQLILAGSTCIGCSPVNVPARPGQPGHYCRHMQSLKPCLA